MDAMTRISTAFAQINPPAEAVACDGIERGIREETWAKAVKGVSDEDAWRMMMAAAEGAMGFSKGRFGTLNEPRLRCRSVAAPHLRGTLNVVLPF